MYLLSVRYLTRIAKEGVDEVCSFAEESLINVISTIFRRMVSVTASDALAVRQRHGDGMART